MHLIKEQLEYSLVKQTQKEKDVHALLQEYLIDPKTGIMEVA